MNLDDFKQSEVEFNGQIWVPKLIEERVYGLLARSPLGRYSPECIRFNKNSIGVIYQPNTLKYDKPTVFVGKTHLMIETGKRFRPDSSFDYQKRKQNDVQPKTKMPTPLGID